MRVIIQLLRDKIRIECLSGSPGSVIHELFTHAVYQIKRDDDLDLADQSTSSVTVNSTAGTPVAVRVALKALVEHGFEVIIRDATGIDLGDTLRTQIENTITDYIDTDQKRLDNLVSSIIDIIRGAEMKAGAVVALAALVMLSAAPAVGAKIETQAPDPNDAPIVVVRPDPKPAPAPAPKKPAPKGDKK